MWTPSSEFILRVPKNEKRLYEDNDPLCCYPQWPFRKGRSKKGEFPVIVVRKHFINRGYKVWVSGTSKLGIDSFTLAMFPGARQQGDQSYLNMIGMFGKKTVENFIAIVEKKKETAGLCRHGGDPDLFVLNPQNPIDRFFVEVKAEDFTGRHHYKDDLNDQQRLVFPLIEYHLKCEVRLAKVQIVDTMETSG
jgi:hypothetical protein